MEFIMKIANGTALLLFVLGGCATVLCMIGLLCTYCWAKLRDIYGLAWLIQAVRAYRGEKQGPSVSRKVINLMRKND